LDELSPARLLVGGLQCRELGLPTYDFQAEVLAAFDLADLPSRRELLGDEFWPAWKSYAETAPRRSHKQG
jgi:hypothetical protein